MSLDIILATHPAPLQNLFNMEHVMAYVMAIFLISVFILLFYNRLYILRERDVKADTSKQSERLALVLQTGNLRLWLYDVTSRHYIMLSKVGEYVREYNPIEFSNVFDRDDFENMRKEIFDICEGRRTTSSVTLRSNPNNEKQKFNYEVKLSIFSTDAAGHAKLLLGIQHDISEEVEKQNRINRLLMRYHTVFNSSLTDMLYYDSNGVLTDINEKACRSFNVPDRKMVLQGDFLLKDNPFFSSVKLQDLVDTHATSIIPISEFEGHLEYIKTIFGHSDKLYYESTISPIHDTEGNLEGFYMAGRNVTEMVESYHRQQKSTNLLKKINNDIEAYITNVNYALRVSNVRLMNYYPQSYTLEVSTNIREDYIFLSQLRCIRIASPRFRRLVSSVLNRMDHFITRPIEETIETIFHDKMGRPIWLMFQMVPIKDSQGHIERYFGLCRDMTDMVETESRLAVETKKAQETELLKQSFMTNMSYEIRTPLNTVVGFAELFESDHDIADESIFVEEIKRNSNILLQLVNDILFLSRIDANMLEINKSNVDFAQIFESHCQIGWSGVKPDVKTLIENPYEHLVVEIDQEHLGLVIEKLCISSVQHTDWGYIRAKYDYRHGELNISIEDTGSGIDEQTLPHAFERFVRDAKEQLCGTGLDLPIVQALVHQMGGSVELQSATGKGTTVWVTIPCEAKSVEKKLKIV